ncbi:MAG: pilus assembly protein [Actinomycetota bacterium]|nr:pilus assembly protein [Actinomycetota bacterium]
MRTAIEERGQAAVELVAVLPFVAVLALVLWQLAVAGQAAWLASSAARAAARAQAVRGDAAAAARGVLPDRLEQGLRVRARPDGSVAVSVPVPSVVGRAQLTTVAARARFEPQGG